jgi:hypothetical protein
VTSELIAIGLCSLTLRRRERAEWSVARLDAPSIEAKPDSLFENLNIAGVRFSYDVLIVGDFALNRLIDAGARLPVSVEFADPLYAG